MAGGAQERADHVAVHRDIVHQRAGLPVGIAGVPVAGVAAGARGRGRDIGRRQLQPEHAAAAWVGEVADLAAHQRDDPRGDRQAEAGAFHRGRGVQPLEFLEQPAAVGFVDAAARYRRPRCRSPPGAAPASTRNSTLPAAVYFTALPSRLSSTWRSRAGSATICDGAS